MNGFRNRSRSSQVWRYRCVGSRAVRLEVRELWAKAADVWWLAAHIAPRTDWQQFAWQRAEYCQRRSRVRPDIHHVLQEVVDVRRKSKNMHIGLTPSRCSVAQRRKREKASFPRFRRFDIICEWHLSYIQT